MAETEEFYRLLGGRVEAARRRRGLTQAALGKRLTPPQTRASISNIEKGTQRVLAHTLVQLAAALDTTIADLVPGVTAQHATSNVEARLAAELRLSSRELKKLISQLQPKEERP